MNATATIRDGLGLTRKQFLWGLLLVDIEVLLAALYPTVPAVGSVSLSTLVFPLVWINVGLWAIATSRVPPVGRRTKRLGLLVGIGYFLVLAYVGGVIQPGHAFHGHAHAFGFRWAWPLPPGWGPTLLYAGKWVGVTLTPYKLVGYAALAYLVYVTVLDAAGSAIAGVVGLFSCVSCTWPVIGTVVAGLFGSASAATAFAMNQSYLLSTLVFLTSVGLLRWRPGFLR